MKYLSAFCLTVLLAIPGHAEEIVMTVKGPVSPDVPASILQRHDDCALFLDEPAASLLSGC